MYIANFLYLFTVPVAISFSIFGHNHNLQSVIKPSIPHKTVVDIAKLNVLMYDYDKTFKLKKNQTIQEFVRESNNIESIKKSNQKLFKELSMASPNGLVENFIDDDKHDIQCGITISNKNKRITVVFRGSDSLKDWLYNLRFNKKRLNNEEKVHYGYYNLLHQNNIRGRLVTNIKNILKIYSDYELFITGHSAGSGLAIIFGYCLSQDVKKQINIITFAAPRIGNLLFRKAFENKKNLKHYRITNEHDIVPGLPLFFDYHHVGNNIHLKRNSVEYYNNYSYSYFKFSLLNCFSIPDHCMYKHLINLINNPW